MYRSKMVIIVFPRNKRLTREQLVKHGAIDGIMSLMSVGGTIESGKLVFELSEDPGKDGIPLNWFTGDSHFRVEVTRVLEEKDYNTLYHWCCEGGVPVFRGEENGEGAVMVIGPHWEHIIDEIIERAIPSKKAVRQFAPQKRKEETGKK